jgi:hypothetical protein
MILSAFVVGCSRNYAVNIDLKSNDIIGQWIPISTPSAVTKLLTTNSSLTKLDLHPNGTADLHFFPIEDLTFSGQAPVSTWSVVTGPCKWGLRDWGVQGKHIWKVEIETQTKGIGLTVGKLSSGQLILVYTPDPDKAESVKLQRRSQQDPK